MTAPEARAGGLDGNARGLLVLAVALVVGFLLLWGGGDSGGGTDVSASGSEPTTETTEAPSTDTSTTAAVTSTTAPVTTDTRAPAEVTVVVLNDTGPTGAAAAATEQIGDAGYTMGTPANAPSGVSVDATTIFYAEDYEADATEIALLLGKSADAVSPLSDVTLGGAEGDANVVVILGSDTPPVSGN